MRARFLFIILAFATALITGEAPPAGKPPAPPAPPATDELYDLGKSLFDQYATPEIKEQYEFPTRERWDAFAGRLQHALDGNDLGELAAYETEARAALVALRDSSGPEISTAVWLEESQRLLGSPESGGWLSPQQVAQKVGLSYENFRKQFAARTTVSPGQFQKRKRVERAQSAIYHGGQSLKQLAEELEFCDVFHFSKAFKQVTGTTPSEFRRKVHGG